MKCRHCHSELKHTFVDLGFAPPSNSYLSKEDLSKPEISLPLRVRVCHECWLVQTEDYTQPETLFNEGYAYFSSASQSWLLHAKSYAEQMQEKLNLSAQSLVIELASNDGYLLRNFLEAEIPCLGIEPTHSTAEAARHLGIPVLEEFFGQALADRLCKEGQKADLIVANNVYAHVPDINDFTQGIATLLKPQGVVTIEFPHLLQLLKHCQFDTIYHEHFSYLSLFTVNRIFESFGLRVFDVQELSTHGGSLRIFGCHKDAAWLTQSNVGNMLEQESFTGMQSLEAYEGFQKRVDSIKDALVSFLIQQKLENKKVVAYGAAAKGNTLLNYAGIRPDLLPVVFDAAPSKQDKYMPGSHIPILPSSQLNGKSIDYILILPWNIAHEVMQQNAGIQLHGARFVLAVPEMAII